MMDSVNRLCLVLVLIWKTFSHSRCQESCIFGGDDDCYFPCGCSPSQNSMVLCDSVNGQCYSHSCERGYSLSESGEFCTPYGQNFRDLGAELYLVHPVTGVRLTDNLYETRDNFIDINSNCSDLLDPGLIDFNETAIWEFDLKRHYLFKPRPFRFYYYRFRPHVTAVHIYMKNSSYTTGHIYNCTFSRFYIYCPETQNVIARHLYFKFVASEYVFKCFPFERAGFRYVPSYFLELDCPRCLQKNASSCGNGLWCETCSNGWRPPDCRRPCEPGYHGINCHDTYSFDWNGTVDITETTKSSVEIYYQCFSVIPLEYQHYFRILVQELLSSGYETVRIFPFNKTKNLVHIEKLSPGQHTFRFVLSGHATFTTAYGAPSDVISVNLDSPRDSVKYDSLRDSKPSINGFEIAFAVAMLVLVVLLVYWIVHRRRSKRPLFPCIKLITQCTTREGPVSGPSATYQNTNEVALDPASRQMASPTEARDTRPMGEESPYELEDWRRVDGDSKQPAYQTEASNTKGSSDPEMLYQGTYANFKDPNEKPSIYETLNM